MKWAQEICAGTHSLFRGAVCEFFDGLRRACVLLKDMRLDEIFQSGRCTFTMLDFAQDQSHRRSGKKPRGLDERDDLNVERMIERMKRMDWGDTITITGWMACLDTTARRVVLNALIRQKILPGRKTCGSCQSLPRSKPYVCQVSGESKRKGNAACKHYRFLQRRFVSESDVDPNDSYTEVHYQSAAIDKSEETSRQVNGTLDVEALRLALRRRAETAKEGTHRKTVLIRQYDLFVNLHKLLREVDSETEAFKILSKRMGVSRRMLRRDMAEIRQFLSFHFQ